MQEENGSASRWPCCELASMIKNERQLSGNLQHGRLEFNFVNVQYTGPVHLAFHKPTVI